jgi:hypothetical protein
MIATLPLVARQADALPSGVSALPPPPPGPPVYFRTPGGVVYEVLNEGSGPSPQPGDTVQYEYTLRRGNGYFIYSTQDCGLGCGDGSPAFATLGTTPLVVGLEELLLRLRPGERVRALVPPALGYTREGLEPQPPDWGQRRQLLASRQQFLPLLFEVTLVKTRRLRP